MPSLCTDAVCQKSVPERREIFSGVVSFSSTSSTSKSFAIVEPFRACFSGNEAAGMLTVSDLFTCGSGGREQEDYKRAWMYMPLGVRRGHGLEVRLIRKIHETEDMAHNIVD